MTSWWVALAAAWPVVVGRYGYPPATVLLGVVAHLAAAPAGTAVGLLCARPVVTRCPTPGLAPVLVAAAAAVARWWTAAGRT